MSRIEEYALRLARECIQSWADVDRGENNDEWETDFTDEEIDQIVDLALRCKVVLP